MGDRILSAGGGPSNDGIAYGARNYQNCKAYSKGYNNGEDASDEDKALYAMDMGYWEQYCLASGAISMEICAMGPNWMASVAAWENQMKIAGDVRGKLETSGFPLMGTVGEP